MILNWLTKYDGIVIVARRLEVVTIKPFAYSHVFLLLAFFYFYERSALALPRVCCVVSSKNRNRGRSDFRWLQFYLDLIIVPK